MFKPPKLDTCKLYDIFHVKKKYCSDQKKGSIKQHFVLADVVCKCKEEDRVLVVTDEAKTVLASDLQQCLPIPILSANTAYYKWQLWVYNLTIRERSGKDNSTECFTLHEANRKDYILSMQKNNGFLPIDNPFSLLHTFAVVIEQYV
jgi:hypothetical protein